MRRWIIAVAVATCAFLGTEGLARLAFDFPLYAADQRLGYWPRPNQRGTFLFVNDWAFNEHSLGVAQPFAPSNRMDILLVGDSLVYGGNELKQAEKLGPLIAEQSGWSVWPAAAGSWGLQNELEFLRRHPDLVKGSDAIVVVVNSGDLTAPSAWKSPHSHPLERPRLYLPYLFNRYVRKVRAPSTSPLPVPELDVFDEWARFVAHTDVPILLVAYSSSSERHQECRWLPLKYRKTTPTFCYDAGKRGGDGLFRDAIHPSVLGNRLFARWIVRRLSGAV